ncbi:MAG TPA: HlyD family efflux transporter periplasmic adaptor subunit [Candidatus Paceibacterota bacterium]
MQPEKQPFSFKKIWAGKRKYWVIAGIVILVIIILTFFGGSKKDTLRTVTASLGSITQEVSVTGTVKAADSVDLAFEKSGRVSWVAKDVGESVYSGELIVSLDNGTEEAALQSAEARYEELSKGSRPEEIQISESALSAAKQTLINDYGSVINTINDAYNKTDNAVNVQTDPIFSNDRSSNTDLTFNVSSNQVKNDAVSSRITMNLALKSFKMLVDAFVSSLQGDAAKDAALQDVKNYLLTAQDFMIKVSSALDTATNLSDTTISAYKTDVSTGRTNINTALTSVNNLIETLASQKIAVEKAERELNLKKLGATKEVLDQAAADVKSAEATLRKTIIRSPINGVVTLQDAKVGEIASAGSVLVSVMSVKSFKIEAYVPEVDSTKLSIDDEARITLDAYGNDVVFKAKVVSINPAEYVIDGVSTYKTTLIFTDEPRPIRSGMTANIDIQTEEKSDVLVLPQRSVISRGGKKYVELISADGKTTER